MATAGAGSVVVGPVQIGPFRSLLERFRRSAGVPASVGVELAAELAPVFAALDAIEIEVARLRGRAEASAVARLQQVDEEVAHILAEARTLAARERDGELRSALRRADAEVEVIARQAVLDAEATRRRCDERLPGLVAEVIARVREAGT
jgi:hypothetical protein